MNIKIKVLQGISYEYQHVDRINDEFAPARQHILLNDHRTFALLDAINTNSILEYPSLDYSTAVRPQLTALCQDNSNIHTSYHANENTPVINTSNDRCLISNITNTTYANNSSNSIEICVTSSDNLSICVCHDSNNWPAVVNSGDDSKICPRCYNTIEDRSNALNLKRSTLTNKFIVNSDDTNYLNLKPYQYDHYSDPYTPETIESHSPTTEIDDMPVFNDSDNEEDKFEASKNNLNMNKLDILDNDNDKSRSGVSPNQLKARLDAYLSTDNVEVSNTRDIVPTMKQTNYKSWNTKKCVVL